MAEQCVATGRDAQLAVALAASCLRTPQNKLACWGANVWGQVGQGSEETSRYPTPRMVPGDPWISISAGAGIHFLALDQAEHMWGWGYNGDGGLGVGDRTTKYAPTRAKSTLTWAVLHAGSGHSCAQNRWGQLYCWGRNSDGELGLGDNTDRGVPVVAASARVWSVASVGWGHTCALAQDGAPWCWGRNNEGQLGLGHNEQRNLPEPVSADTKFQSLSAHGLHTCAIAIGTQQLWCWGDNRDGKLGSGDQNSRNLPTLIAPERRWQRITTGRYSTCGITIEGEAWCWGRNAAADPDTEDANDVLVPTRAAEGNDWYELAAGHSHVCGMRKGVSTPLCWGREGEGQLGQGSSENQPSPVPVLLPQ